MILRFILCVKLSVLIIFLVLFSYRYLLLFEHNAQRDSTDGQTKRQNRETTGRL